MKECKFSIIFLLILLFLMEFLLFSSPKNDLTSFILNKVDEKFVETYRKNIDNFPDKEIRDVLISLKDKSLASLPSFHADWFALVEKYKNKGNFPDISPCIAYLILNYGKYNFYFKELYLKKLLNIGYSNRTALIMVYFYMKYHQNFKAKEILNELKTHKLTLQETFYYYHFLYKITRNHLYLEKIISLKEMEVRKYYLLLLAFYDEKKEYLKELGNYSFDKYFKAIYVGEKILYLETFDYQDMHLLKETLPYLPQEIVRNLFIYLNSNIQKFVDVLFVDYLKSEPASLFLNDILQLFRRKRIDRNIFNHLKTRFKEVKKDSSFAIYGEEIKFYLGELAFRNLFMDDALYFFEQLEDKNLKNSVKDKIEFLYKCREFSSNLPKKSK